MSEDRSRRTLAVTSGAALVAAVVTALRRRPWGTPPWQRSRGGGPSEGPDPSGVREPRVPPPTGGAAAAEAESPAP